MKKKCLTVLLLICCIPAVYSTSFDFSLKNAKNGTSIVMETSTSKTKFLISLMQDVDGFFTLRMPPSFCISWEPYLQFGELKPSGIVKLTLDPSDTTTGLSGFNQKRFDVISVPALHPEYSGIAIPFENFDIFTFSPILNPESPLAFGTDVSFKNCFISAILSDYGHIDNVFSDKYQIDWINETNGNKELTVLAGAVSSNQLGKNHIKTQSFVHFADNNTNGIQISTGTDISLKIKKCDFIMKKRFSSKADKSLLIIKLHDIAQIDFSDCIYPKPIYGGLYQKREIELNASIEKDSFSLISNKKFSLSENGNVKKTDSYKLAFKGLECRIDLRTDGNEISFESWNIIYSDDILKSELSDKGIKMSLTKRIRLSEKSRIIITLNQDRMLSINYSTEN